MTDRFLYHAPGLTSPTANHFNITPHDINELQFVTRSIWVGTGGDLTVVDVNGNTVTFMNVPDGYEKQGRFKRVLSTGTTASDLVGGY